MAFDEMFLLLMAKNRLFWIHRKTVGIETPNQRRRALPQARSGSTLQIHSCCSSMYQTFGCSTRSAPPSLQGDFWLPYRVLRFWTLFALPHRMH